MAFDKKQFGAAVKRLRVGLGLKQVEIAKRSGLLQPVVSKIEQGKCPVSIDKIEKLSKALDVPAGCLSVLAFQSMSNVKEIEQLSKSLKKLIFSMADCRNSVNPVIN